MQKLSPDEIKKEECRLLEVYKDICDSEGLKWYLGGGTLLGAIRHKGFIPWDDDIDVMMPRKDYDIFIEKCRKSFPEHMKVLDYSHGTCDYPYAKLINKNILVEEENISSKYSHNLWIDIFPIDGNPDDDTEYTGLCEKIGFYRKLLIIGIYKDWHGTTFLRKAAKAFIIAPLIRLYGLKRISRKIDMLSRKYDIESCNQVGCLVWGYGTKERVDKTGFLKTDYAEFEGINSPVPSNYDEYLTKHYGKYMELPKASEREAHNITAWRVDRV